MYALRDMKINNKSKILTYYLFQCPLDSTIRRSTVLSKFDYVKPQLLTEALNYLEQNAGTRILAGGTDLMIILRRNAETPEHILDIKGIPETNRLEYKTNDRLIYRCFSYS